MASSIRELRRRIRAVQSIRKTTRAYELIATARIAKAQAAVAAAKPYADEITRALSALAGSSALDHPLLVERPNPRRAAVLVVTSDRGFCGAYNSAVIRAAEELQALLRDDGKEPVLYVLGRKGVGYYRFRERAFAGSWTGFSEQPRYLDAREAAREVIAAFVAGADDNESGAGADGVLGVDEIHVVHTRFKSMLAQEPVANRVAPLVVEEVEYREDSGPQQLLPAYEFEPDPDTLLDALLPKYVTTRIYAALLEAAASESAARRRAMKAATDNADELIGSVTREMNQARQAQITQEISEIVGGAEALAATAGSDD